MQTGGTADSPGEGMSVVTEAQLAGILSIADDAVITVDEAQRIILFNKGAERVFGYAVEEAIGQPLELLLPPGARVSHAAHVAEFGASGTAARRMGERSEIAGRRRDGSEFPAEASISCFNTGTTRIYTAIVRDVTEQKRQAEALNNAKRAAELADEAKSMFLANMSHEIRTPLNAIIGMTSLLLYTDLADEQRDFVQTIRTGGDSLLTIINEILDFTKIELGSLEIDPHPFNVRQVIEESLDQVAAVAAEKNLNLAYIADDSVPAVVVSDGLRLRQILLNTLSNAVKFTRQGEVVVNVEAFRTGQARYELHFSVVDTGIGIREEERDRIFKPFSQVDASTTREYGGTGLGLAISQRLCEMLGGRIWVESIPGRGSTFHFTMLAEQGTEMAGAHVRGAQPQLAGKRVLIVDDIATNRRILVKHLLKWGMLPQAVASALEALDLIRDGHAFDLAILDLSMPQMDGVQLARAIRRTRNAQTLPLMLLTSMGHRQKQVESAGVEFSACLHKPIKPSQLFDTLMTLIGGGVEGSSDDFRPAVGPGLAMRLPLDILVAEDNAINQKVVLRMLAHLGYQADTAANGREVLGALERRNYDVVLMDIQMPEMDGIETTRHILERYPSDSRPYVIAMTANALHGDRERLIAAGMDDYVGKPVDIEDMARALQRRPQPAAPSSAMRPGVIDVVQLTQLRQLDQGGDASLCDEVIDHFLDEVPDVAAKLTTCAQQGDGAGLADLAHRLGSTALACGARRVADVCMMLERAGKQGPPSVVQALLQRLTREYEQAKSALIEEKALAAAASRDGEQA